MRTTPLAEILLSRATKDQHGCLIYRAKTPYPGITIEGKTKRVTRVAFETFKGQKIPEGYYVCHTCDNPRCINPEHLFLSTPMGNARDRDRKGRGAKGSRVGTAKLSEKTVLAVRLCAQKNHNISAVAREFNLPYSAVYAAVKGETWKHVAMERA